MGIRIAALACALCAAIGWPGSAAARAVEGNAAKVASDEADDVDAGGEDAEASPLSMEAWRVAFGLAPRVAPASWPVWWQGLVGAGEGAEEYGDSFASGMRSFAVGPGAYAYGESSTAIGALTEVDGEYGLAVGNNAWARYDPTMQKPQTHQVAIGSHAVAWGDRAVAIGGRAGAYAGFESGEGIEGTAVVAVGTEASAIGRFATAVGDSAAAESWGSDASAFGAKSWALATRATSLGGHSMASYDQATAVGALAMAQGVNTVAVGAHAWANGNGALAIGGSDGIDANKDGGIRSGEATFASGRGANAIGLLATATGAGTVAIGHQAFAQGVGAQASGRNAIALGEGALSSGDGAQASGFGAVSIGSASAADGKGALAFGGAAFATGEGASAIGYESVATAPRATTLGANSMALSADSVALGADSVADQAMTVSIGSAGRERRIVHVADGIDDTDAANYGQVRRLADTLQGVSDSNQLAVHYDDATRKTVTLDAGTKIHGLGAGRIAASSYDAVNGSQLFALYERMASVFGGNAAMGTDAFTGPSYALDNGTFADVGGALDALQSQSRALRDRLAVLETGTGGGGKSPHVDVDGPKDGSDTANSDDGKRGVAIGAKSRSEGNGATAIGEGAHAIGAGSVAIGQGSVAQRANTVSVGAQGKERQVANVARATEATDAVNLAQMQEADAQVLSSARNYVDLRVDQALAAPMAAIGELRADMDVRMAEQELRIDRQSAMTSAAMNMAASAAGVRTQNRVAVGAGTAGGEQALALGYQRAISERAAITFGGAFSSGESSAGVGFSWGW